MTPTPESNNYMQAGETIECGACFPDKYTDCGAIWKDYGIKCECKCHKSPPESMEERFDKRFVRTIIDPEDGEQFLVMTSGTVTAHHPSPEEVLEFIRAEIALARNSALEEAIEIVEGRKATWVQGQLSDKEKIRLKNIINNTLDEVVAKLKELKK